MTSFTSKNILKAFEATGVVPADAEVILRRFRTPTPAQEEDPEIGQHGDGDSWRQLRNLFDAAVKDGSEVKAKQLSASLHSLQVQNELLRHENGGLRSALTTKKKHKTKSKPLDLQQRKEFQSTAVFWSPRKVREARARDEVKMREEEELKLQKSKTKELKAAATMYKKIEKEKAKGERERVREVKKKEREAKAERLAAARAQKKQEKEAATTKKSAEQVKRPILAILRLLHQK